MSDGPRVGLLFGGRSVEHEVSLSSARCVVSGLEQARFLAVPIAVTGEGLWLGPDRSEQILRSDAKRAERSPAASDDARVVTDPGRGLFVVEPDGRVRSLDLDVVFPLVHGWGGEDGRVQGLLDTAGVACVGAGVLGSAVAMDKVLCRRLLDAQGIPGVEWLAVDAAEHAREGAGFRARVSDRLGYPVFVKPSNGGSSVGVTKVTGPEGLDIAIDAALQCDRRVIVEKGVDAREVECAVIGGDPPETSVLGEIVPSGEFYDYDAKYVDDASELIIPADLDPRQTERIRAWSAAAFRALDLWGLARVDFLVERSGTAVYLNEVNTLPGFSPISMFPKLWQASGVPLPELLKRLVGLAIERRRQGREMRTSRTED